MNDVTYTPIADLAGRTLVLASAAVGDERMTLRAEDGTTWTFYHSQECCESVEIEDITGDLADLVGSPLTLAEEATQENVAGHESATWTFYRFATERGFVTVRWLGVSNGCYSERVDCDVVAPEPAHA